MAYPIDREFNEGPQPAKTHELFGGTLPGQATPGNLLLNGDFEDEFYFQDGVPEYQVPKKWTLNVFNGPNPHDPNPFVPPEIRKVTKAGLPAGEWEEFGLSGNQAVKIFKGSGSWNASLSQVITPLQTPANMIVKGFADLVVGYGPGNAKIYATYDPDNPAGLWRVNGGEWYLVRPGEINEAFLELPAGTTKVEFEMMCPYPLATSGFFLDDFRLLENTMPDPVPYIVVVDLLPQDAKLWEKRWVVEKVHTSKETILQSADDAARLVAPGKAGSRVKVWDAHRWTGGDIVQYLKDKGVSIVEVLDLPEDNPF
jgi:hypothetical protein